MYDMQGNICSDFFINVLCMFSNVYECQVNSPFVKNKFFYCIEMPETLNAKTMMLAKICVLFYHDIQENQRIRRNAVGGGYRY